MVGGSGDAEHNTSLHSPASSAHGSMPWLCRLLLLLELKCHRSGTRLAILELSCGLGTMVSLCHHPGLLKIHDDKPCCPECLPVVGQRTMKPDKLCREMCPWWIDAFPLLEVREAPAIAYF